MKQIFSNGLTLWQFEALANETDIKHFVTDRHTADKEKEFTLSFSSSPDKEEVRNNRKVLATAMGIESTHLFFPSQVHQTHIAHVTPETSVDELRETDALITDQKGICIAVMSADCVPILLYDRKHSVVAAIHSGWRGTVARILEKTLREMRIKFGTAGENLIAAIGPSVCQDSYEVGEEVVNEVLNAFGNASDLMITKPNGKAQLDLWKANKIQLMEFGVTESAIEISNLCTVKNNQHFFSARKGDTGRLAAGIMLM